MVYVEPGVIEGRTQPTRRRMAERTGRGETRCDVVGIVRSLVIRLVAAITIGLQGRVIVVHVATRARHRGVSSRQREGSVVVIE